MLFVLSRYCHKFFLRNFNKVAGWFHECMTSDAVGQIRSIIDKSAQGNVYYNTMEVLMVHIYIPGEIRKKYFSDFCQKRLIGCRQKQNFPERETSFCPYKKSIKGVNIRTQN